MAPSLVEISDVFRRLYYVFLSQPWLCIAIELLALVIPTAAALPIRLLVFATAIAAEAEPAIALPLVFLLVVVVIGTFVLALWLRIGAMIAFLKIARGEPADVKDLFSGRPYLGRVVGASLVIGLMVLGGYLLCIVPGIILALMYSETLYLIVDRDMRVGQALACSRQITRGNKAMLLLIGLVAALVGGAIMQVSGGLAMLIVYPAFSVIGAVTYLVMTGQPTVDRPPFVGRAS